MPINYNPGQSYTGAQSTAQGFGAIASGIQDLMKKQEEERLKQELIQRDISKSDIIVNHAKQSGLISENDWHDYVTAAGTKKVDIAQGLAANMVTDQIIKQRDQAKLLQTAQIGHLGAQTNLGESEAWKNYTFPTGAPAAAHYVSQRAGQDVIVNGKKIGVWDEHGGVTTLPAAALAEPDPNANKPIVHPLTGQQLGFFDNKGKPSYYPTEALSPQNEPSKTDPLLDEKGKVVPGKVIIRKTGALADTTTGTPQLVTDPTGKFYFDKKGNAKPIPVGLIDMPDKNAPLVEATPAPSKLNPMNWFSSGAAGPTPTATPPLAAAAGPANTGPAVAAPPPAVGGTALGPSVGPYKAGYSYSGKVYLGGDPNNPASWSK